MVEKRVGDLLGDVPDAEVSGNPATTITSITFDSRKVTPGSLFVALRGGYADGHDFLPQARERGAVAVLVEPETPDVDVDGFQAVIRRSNTREALAPVAASFFDHPSRALTLIGVTGTDGKTSTCFYITQMLRSAGVSAGLISTVSVQVPGKPERSSQRQTTPESLDVQATLREMVDAGASVAVLETTSHALETYRVNGCAYDIGVVTNVTREHLDFHGSVENYRRSKAGLLQRVDDARTSGTLGIVVLNADDEGTRAISPAAGRARALWYSASGRQESSIRATDVVNDAGSSRGSVQIDGNTYPFSIPIPGSWNVSNALAALGAVISAGVPVADAVAGLSKLEPVPGRLAAVDTGQPFSVLVDYAHTPESIRSVLQEVRGLTSGRVLVLFGSAGERDIEKRELQGAIAAELADFSIFTSEDPRFEDPENIISAIAAGAERQGARRGVDFDCIEDRRRAILDIVARAGPGDIVVLAGKGHEKSMIYGAEHRPWDEEQVARDALRQLGFGREEDEGRSD